MIELLKISFKNTLRNWWISLLFYGVSLVLLAFPLGVFYTNLSEAAAHKGMLESLVDGFDFMVFSDFMRENGKAFRSAFLWAALAGFIGSLIYTFLSGGAVSAYLTKEKATFGQFFKDSARLFPKYLLLLILLGLLLFSLFLVCGLFFFVFALIAEGSSERGYVMWSLPPFILLALTMTFGLTVSFYAKVFLALESRMSTVDAFWKAFSFILKRLETLGYFWFLILVGIGLAFMYLFTDKWVGMHSSISIALMLFIQQMLVFARVFLKNWNYALAARYVMANPIDLYREIDKLSDLQGILHTEHVGDVSNENSPNSSGDDSDQSLNS